MIQQVIMLILLGAAIAFGIMVGNRLGAKAGLS